TVEAAIGIGVLANGVAASSDLVTGLGVGGLFGGIATWAIAPRMVQPTAEGGRIRAQLAAYRRTRQQTFRTALDVHDAVGRGGLTWLATPDEALVWGFGLGLRDDIAALLARTRPTGTTEREVTAPDWYRLRRGRRTGTDRSRGVATPAEAF